MIIGATTYPVVVYTPSVEVNSILFDIPMNMSAQTGFTIVLNSIRNPPLNAACGAVSNTYFSAAPCNSMVYLGLPNSTYTGSGNVGYNYYHHNGVPMFNITSRPYFVESISEQKVNFSNAQIGKLEQEVVSFNVKVSGSTGVFPIATQFNLSQSGTINMASIQQVKLYSTGTENFFHSNYDILISSQINPIGTTSFLTNFTLSKGDNYFFSDV